MDQSQKNENLRESAKEGKFENVKFWIVRGANVNSKDDNGWTALHFAISPAGLSTILPSISGISLIKYLIDNGADINAKNNKGWTALMLASIYGFLEIVKFLVNSGADVNIKDNDGWTALDFASKKGPSDIAYYLLENGAKDDEYDEDNERKIVEEEIELKPVILVCGKTGAGKSTLLQSIFGKDIVPDDKIGVGRPVTQGFECYEDKLLTIYDSKGLETDKGVDDFIKNLCRFIDGKASKGTSNIEEHINCHWYVIDGGGARIEDSELKIINVFPKESTIIIFSKSDRMDAETCSTFENIIRNNGYDKIMHTSKPMDIEELRKQYSKDVESYKKLGMSDAEIDKALNEYYKTNVGVNELYEKTREMMPEAQRTAIDRAQKVDREKRENATRTYKARIKKAIEDKDPKADDIIYGVAAGSAAAGAIPLPIADSAVITTAQLGMVYSLGELYGVGFQKEQLMPLLASVAGRLTAVSLSKLIPGVGSIIGAGVAGTLTISMGFYIKDKFKEIALAKVDGINLSASFDQDEYTDYSERNKEKIERASKSTKK